MPNEEKVYPESGDTVETTYSDQESDEEKVYEEKQIPLAMTISKKKVLYEFRCKVEDAIQNNYIFKKETFHFTHATKNREFLNELRLWGVPLLPSKGHESTDVVLMKFLEARQFKLSEAFNLLQRTLKWRMEMDMEQILHEKLGSDLEELGHIGNTKAIEGQSLCYKRYGIYKNKDLYKERFDAAQDKYEDYLRWNIQFMERCVQTLDFKPGGTNSIISIIDMKDAPVPLIKELPTLHKKTLVLFQDYYPGIIDRHVILNAPLWLLTFHALQLRTLTQRNYGKFVFVRPFSVSKTLLKFIAPEDLPVEYGGLKQEHDELFTSNKKVQHQRVKPGSVECFQIPVDKAGMTVFWDLTVVGFEVSYKEEFIPDDNCSYQILIQKEKKLGKSIRNSFHVREPGKIVLHIENTTYKNKTVFCRHLIQPTVTNFTLSIKD